MEPSQQIPWWAERLVVPAIFVVVGAVVGFVVGQLKDSLDARNVKKAFLKAIRLELAGLREQLQASLDEVIGAEARAATNPDTAPQLAGTLRMVVFTTQLSKLRDISDPLVIEVIKLYSDLPVLEQIMRLTNSLGAEYSVARGAHPPIVGEQRELMRGRIRSALRTLREQLDGFIRRIDGLLLRLPT